MDLTLIDFWHWWIFAIVLLIIEIMAPAFFALWMSIAALVTGATLYFMPELSWEIQCVLFAVLSVLSIVLWRNYYVKNPIKTDEPLLNRRGEQYMGRVITLKSPIVDGIGKVSVDDSTWKVMGQDCVEGTKVKIVSVNNVIFNVEIVK
jgi:membrane protein implicated in regulation of membrane protease activity